MHGNGSKQKVNKVENEEKETKEMSITKLKMFFKFVKLFLYRIGKRKWFIPAISEITVDQLYENINSNQSPIIIDVRDRREFNGAEGSDKIYGHIQNARCIPIMQLSAHLEDLTPFKEKKIVTICPGGGMSLIAAEILGKAGFKDVKSLTGGMDLWDKKGYPTVTAEDSVYDPKKITPESLKDGVKINKEKQPYDDIYGRKVHKTLNARNLTCPMPILKSRKELKAMKINQVLEILTTDPASWNDIPAWAEVSGQELISAEEKSPREFRFLVRRLKSSILD
jgi:tRNA 2-thiouridine synthesizing protein A